MSQEIVQEGVSTIEISSTALSTKVFQPEDGRIKWFLDDLGLKWVGFSTPDALHICPADLVVEVCFYK